MAGEHASRGLESQVQLRACSDEKAWYQDAERQDQYTESIVRLHQSGPLSTRKEVRRWQLTISSELL